MVHELAVSHRWMAHRTKEMCRQSHPDKPFNADFCNSVLLIKRAAVLITICTVCGAARGTDGDLVSLPQGHWQHQPSDVTDVRLLKKESLQEAGYAFTRFRFSSAADIQPTELIATQPAALMIDDFRATVRLNSTQKGVRLGLRMVFPQHRDPRTRSPLVTYLFGDTYQQPENWQNLTVSSTKSAVEQKIRQLRSELQQRSINTVGAYFDGCVLQVELHRGSSFVDVATPTYGPIIAPPAVVLADRAAQSEQTVNRRVRVDRERLLVDDRPVYPRFVPDHGESVAMLKQLGVNGAWVSDVHAKMRMREIAEHNLLVLATPPHPTFDPNDFSAPIQGLPPLEQNYPLPSIWYLGTDVKAHQMPHLLGWAREVQSADRERQRPLMADVLAATGVASRQVDFVGVSQLKVGGRRSFGEVRNVSHLRQSTTAQLTMPWEWIRAEPPEEIRQWRRRTAQRPVRVDPEQILMQLAASLSAGSRGVGFWKTQSLESDDPYSQELSRCIELANVYIRILEPILVQGRIDGHIPVRLTATKSDRPESNLLNARTAGRSEIEYDVPPTAPDGAIVNSYGTSLVLAAHWDSASQFVPQKLYAPHAAMTVATTETASAWRLSPTGTHGLRRTSTAGGLYLQIEDFDMLDMILVSSDHQTRKLVEARVYEYAERAAQLFLELSELKLERVANTCAEIDRLTESNTSAADQLSQAQNQTVSARAAFDRRDFPKTESAARAAMRLTRRVQNQYWRQATQPHGLAAASPHTLSFSTLPDHWAMIRQMKTLQATENLIPSGSFNSLRLLSGGRWKPVAPQQEAFHAGADIVTDGRQNNHVLRMRAWRHSTDDEGMPSEPTLLMRCPEVVAERGDIFEIRGEVRLGSGVPASHSQPFLIFDSDLGPEAAVSPLLEPSWRPFRIYRQASQSGPFRIWMALQGSAEVFIDNISVVRHSASSEAPRGPLGATPAASGTRGSRVQGAGYSNPSFP